LNGIVKKYAGIEKRISNEIFAGIAENLRKRLTLSCKRLHGAGMGIAILYDIIIDAFLQCCSDKN
jgi:hypothetical protein